MIIRKSLALASCTIGMLLASCNSHPQQEISVEKFGAIPNDGINDFVYACDVLANYYNLSPMGDYTLVTDWSYSFIEDDSVAWNQLVQGKNQGVIKKVELRQFIRPDEKLEEAQKIIEEIEAQEPTTKDLLGE